MNEIENGGAEMSVKWETTRVNFWHLGAIAVSIAINACAVGVTYTTMQFNDKKNSEDIADLRVGQQNEINMRVERGKITDAKFQALNDKMPQFDILAQQILRLTDVAAQNTKAIEETNKRIERIVDATTNKLDTIIARQAEQGSDIKVIQSQLAEQQRAANKRTTLAF